MLVTKVERAEVLRRAKALCEQDGKLWDMEFTPVKPRGTPITLKPILDDVGRCEYLARAREQLLKDCGKHP